MKSMIIVVVALIVVGIASISCCTLKKKSTPRTEFTDEEYEQHFELKMEVKSYLTC